VSTVADTARLAGVRRIRARTAALPRPTLPLFAGIVALAALLFLVDLGRSSFFIDEMFSYNVSSHSLSDVADGVQYGEVTPPLYYYLLYGWIRLTGADSEAMLRLPSALAGIAFVAAVAWVGTVVGGRRAGFVAGLLAALSPLTLQYAQEVRSYIFAMLFVALAVGAAIRLSQSPRSLRWLAAAMLASALALACNYTAGFVTFPLALWLLFQRDVPRPRRLAFAAATALPILVFAPLLLDQMGAGHHSGTDEYARITSLGLVRLVGTPFDGRAQIGVSAGIEIGLIAVVDAVALLALSDRLRHIRGRWALVGGAVIPVLFVILYSAVVHPSALTRYTAVAAPLMLVALGIAITHLDRLVATGLAAAALVACTVGLVASKLPTGQFPDSRQALTVAGQHWRTGDAMLQLNYLGFAESLDYYIDRLVPPSSRGSVFAYDSLTTAFTRPDVQKAVRQRRRLWLITAPPLWMDSAKAQLAGAGYKIRSQRTFTGQVDTQVVLAVPLRRFATH
jgi:4-amino-4-deoxy-L-arabinose transferase-like glycosyltransferase